MPALDAALSFAKVDHVAEAIGDDLNLDVARALDDALEVEGAAGEVGLGFGLRDREEPRQFLGVVRHAHAAPAAARDRLDHDREAERARHLHGGVDGQQHLVAARARPGRQPRPCAAARPPCR